MNDKLVELKRSLHSENDGVCEVELDGFVKYVLSNTVGTRYGNIEVDGDDQVIIVCINEHYLAIVIREEFDLGDGVKSICWELKWAGNDVTSGYAVYDVVDDVVVDGFVDYHKN